MEEIFLISYHKSNYSCFKQLVNLIDLLKQNDKKFIISSHSSLPVDIIEETTAYIYDKDNDLIKIDPIHNYFVNLQNAILHSPFIHYGVYVDKNYGLSAVKNILTGLNLASQLGYDIVHFIEYDCTPDFLELKDNTNIITQENYSSVIYNFEGNMMGSIFTTKTNNLKTKWIKEYWEQEYKNNDYSAEKFFFSILKNWHTNDKIKIKPYNVDLAGKITSFQNSNLLETVIFEHEGKLNLYINNITKNNLEGIEVYFSSHKMKINLPPNHYQMINLGDKENINFVNIIHNDKIYKKWDISTEENYNKYVKPNKLEIKND